MVNQALTVEAIAWGLDLITIIATAFFFYNFCRIKSKNYGHYMILILTLIDVLLSLFHLLERAILQSETMVNFVASTEIVLFRLSLYWSTAISVFVYLVYKQTWNYSPKIFLLSAIICCLILSSLFPITIYFHIWQINFAYFSPGVYAFQTLNQTFDLIMYLIFYDGIAGLMPICITIYCYYRVYQILKSRERGLIHDVQVNSSRVFWYPFVQIICFFPEFFMDILCSIAKIEYPFSAAVAITLLYRGWGCLNLLIYWLLVPQEIEADQISAKSELTSSNSFSNDMIV